MAIGNDFIEEAFRALSSKLNANIEKLAIEEATMAKPKNHEEVVTGHLMVMFDQLSELGISFEDVVNTMRSRVYEFDKILGIQYAEKNPLSDKERALVLAPANLRIDAIRAYRERLNCPLLFAKEAVDLYETFVTMPNNLRHERARLVENGHLLLW